MHLVRGLQQAPRIGPFPAPLCEPCFEPMKLNGEYTPTGNGTMTIRREYQCRMCGAVMRVMRKPKAV